MIAYYKARYRLNENTDGQEWFSAYPFVSIEDPFDQDDWVAYSKFNFAVGDQVQIVGDDLLVTNPTRVRKALDCKACNALLLKVNQIGSVTEAHRHLTWGRGVMIHSLKAFFGSCFMAGNDVGSPTFRPSRLRTSPWLLAGALWPGARSLNVLHEEYVICSSKTGVKQLLG